MDFYERIIQQHTSNLLNNGLRSNHALFTAKYIKMVKNTVCVDLRKLVHSVFPNLMRDYYDMRRSDGSDRDFHPRFNFVRYVVIFCERMHKETTNCMFRSIDIC